MKTLVLSFAVVMLLSSCAPIPRRPDLPTYSATALHTAVLLNRMYYITLPEIEQ